MLCVIHGIMRVWWLVFFERQGCVKGNQFPHVELECTRACIHASMLFFWYYIHAYIHGRVYRTARWPFFSNVHTKYVSRSSYGPTSIQVRYVHYAQARDHETRQGILFSVSSLPSLPRYEAISPNNREPTTGERRLPVCRSACLPVHARKWITNESRFGIVYLSIHPSPCAMAYIHTASECGTVGRGYTTF